MSTYNWRSKIESLLTKAQSKGTTKEESEALQEKAAYLMAKFGIEDAVARHKEHSNEKPVSEVFKMFPPYANRKLELLVAVGRHMDAQIVVNGRTVYIFAFKEDLERIKVLYFSLLAQLHIDLCSVVTPPTEHGKSFKNSWMVGFIDEIRNRFYRAKFKANSEGPGNALVLADRADKVKSAVNDVFGNLKEKSAWVHQITSREGYERGLAAGSRADIGGAKLGGSTRRRISG